VAAQLPTYGVGRAPTAEEVKDWDLTIPADGQGLPPGSGTAALGKAIYAERCASCHGETGEDAAARYTDCVIVGRGLDCYVVASRPADDPSVHVLGRGVIVG